MSKETRAMPRPGTPSRNPAPRSGRTSRMPSYTFIYLPNETGASRRIQVPKPMVYLLLIGLFGLVGAVTGLSLYARTLRTLAVDYEKLKAENHSIRSEASALVAKLQEVQNNLSRVDRFSDQVREEASQLDPKTLKNKKIKGSLSLLESRAAKAARPGAAGNAEGEGNTKETGRGPGAEGARSEGTQGASPRQGSAGRFPAGIGPLSKEEFEASKKKGAVEAKAVGAMLKVDSLEFKDLFETLDDIRSRSSTQAESLSGLLKELQGYRAKIASTPTIAPVNGLLTSGYGVRVSPITGQNRMHQGLDIAAPMGSPIKSAAQGTVTRVGYADDYGKYVEVSHGFGVLSRYAHASAIHVKRGDKVKKGDVIGAVGMTGRTTGPHLHYEIEIGGRKVDPSGFIASF